MKLDKQILNEMITEELRESNFFKGLKTRAMSATKRKALAKGRIEQSADEFTPVEQGLTDQIEAHVSKVAAIPGVDMSRYKPLLTKILKLITKQIAEPAIEKQKAEQEKSAAPGTEPDQPPQQGEQPNQPQQGAQQ